MSAPPPIDSFETLKAQLKNENLPFRVAADVSSTITLSTKIGSIDSLLHIRWEGTPGIVQFVQTIPLVVPPTQRAAVGALIHRLNTANAIMGYTFDADSGVVSFRTQTFLGAEKSMSAALVGALIGVAAHTVTEDLAAIEETAGVKAASPS